MPAKPWVTFHQPEPNREYLALLSELPLKRFRTFPTFFVNIWQIIDQLKRSPGLIGYSLLAHPARKQFWTLSVWESEAALTEFVDQMPHSRMMTALQGKMGPTRFVRWHTQASEYPPRWQDALARRRAA